MTENILTIIKQKMSNVKSFDEDRLIEYLIYVYEHRVKESSNETENHHIMPHCDFPEYSNFKKNQYNKAILNCRNHFIAHYLLYKAIPTKGAIYGFNQMKRVLKGSDDLILGSILYEEARKDINKALKLVNLGRKHTKEFCENISRRTKNKVVVYDINDSSKTAFWCSINDEKYLSGKYIYYRTGTLHREDTKLKISKNGIVNKNAYNDGDKVIYLSDNENIPAGFILGQLEIYSEMCSERMSGLNYYYNPLTKEHRRFIDGKQPENWIKGKTNFGTLGNPRNGKKICKNFITKKTNLIPAEDNYPLYCGNSQAQIAHIYNGYVTFNPRMIQKLNNNLTTDLVKTMANRLLKETSSVIRINYVKEEYKEYLKSFDTYQEIGLKVYRIEDFFKLPNYETYKWLG